MHGWRQVLHFSLCAACATVAEVRKRGDDFWTEFEFYMSDLVVGCVLDVVLVSLMAPVAVIGAKPKSASATGRSAPPPLFLARVVWVRRFFLGGGARSQTHHK
jgi:Protein RETICULATA-related